MIMKLKFIGCEVFVRSVCQECATSENNITPEFTRKGEHEKVDELRETVQNAIYDADKGDYEAIVLGYGLCGNGLDGIKAGRLKLIIPRAHDCCTIFAGSRGKFLEYFSDKFSAMWSSAGYMERGDEYFRESDANKMLGLGMTYEQAVELYGEENAEFIIESLKPKYEMNEVIYIKTGDHKDEEFLKIIELKAQEENKELRVVEGDMRIIKKLLNGQWDDDFLIVLPGQRIKAVYDHEKVIEAI